MLALPIVITVLVAVTADDHVHPCTSNDTNMQFICRRHLSDLYEDQLSNETARYLYRTHLIDSLLDDSRPSCFAYEFSRRIYQVQDLQIWDSLWLNFTAGLNAPQPCNEIVSVLQTTFAKYGGISFSELQAITEQLVADGSACRQGDDAAQCQADFRSILFLLWDDPDPVGILDLDAAWSNNDAGAKRLISLIQRSHSWSRLCPMTH